MVSASFISAVKSNFSFMAYRFSPVFGFFPNERLAARAHLRAHCKSSSSLSLHGRSLCETSTGCYVGGIYQSDKYSYSHIGKFLTVGNKPVIKFVIETVKYFFRNIKSMFLAFISKDIRNDILMAWAILGIVNRINLMCRYLLNGLGSIISNDGKFFKMNIQNDTEITYDWVYSSISTARSCNNFWQRCCHIIMA